MNFPKDRPLRIMQIADTQESDTISPDTLRLIDAALDEAKPDLVILTGDQIKGYSTKFIRGNYEEKVAETLRMLVEPMVRRGIPFAPTFGNHDSQGKVKKQAQMAIYGSCPGCVPTDANAADCGSYTIPIYDTDGKTLVMNLYVIDSNGDENLTTYTPVRAGQLDWYRAERERLCAENGGYVPSMVFQHIPVPEYLDLLKRVKKRTPKAVRGFNEFKNQFFRTDEAKVWQEDFFGEMPAVPTENTGEFAALKEKGEVFAMYVGHDHANSFVGKLDGIDLGYCPGAGFNVYGPGVRRAVRVLDIPQENPRNYTTFTLSFEKLVGKKVTSPLKNFLYAKAPSSVPAALLLARNVLLGGLGIAAVVVLLIFLLK